MSMIVSRTRYVFGFVLLVLFLISVVPSFAAPPPRPVCSACGEGFVEVAEHHGVSVVVEHSTAVVRVHENGSATWTVRNRINDDAKKRLRANASLLSNIIGEIHAGRLLDANISNGVVTIRYRMDEFAVSSVGNVLRSDHFTGFAYRNYAGLGADRLIVVAPDGMNIGGTVPGATVDGRRMTLTSYTDGAFVTFVPHGTVAGPVLSFLAAATVTVPLLARNILMFISLPSIIFTATVGIMSRHVSQIVGKLKRVSPYSAPVLILLGLLAYLVDLGSQFVLFGDLPPLFGVGTSLMLFGVAISILTARDRVTYWTLVGSAVLAVSVATVAVPTDGNDPLPFCLAVFGLIPAGYVFGQGKSRLSVITGVIGFIAALVFAVPIHSPTLRSFFPFFFILASSVYALALALIGSPLFVIGASLSVQGK